MESFKLEKPKEEKFIPEPKIIGNAPEEVKETVKKTYREYIYGGEDIVDIPREDLENIKSIECEKRSEEIELIKAADDELSRIMKELGLESFDVPADNVHIFDIEQYKKKGMEDTVAGSAGFSSSLERFVGIPSSRRDDLFDFGAVVFHELNHLKGYASLKVDKISKSEIEDNEENKINNDDKSILFTIKKILGLIKEIPVEQKNIGIKEMLKETDAKIDKKEKESEIEVSVYRSGISAHATKEKYDRLTKSFEKRGKPIMLADMKCRSFSGLEEAVVAKMEGKYCEKLLNNPIIKDYQQNKEKYNDMSRGYPSARGVLDMLVSGIYEKNKDDFKSEEDVLNVFIKAHFTGRLLPMSRLIKNTFGKEVFEKVAKMSGNRVSEARDAIKAAKLREKIKNL